MDLREQIREALGRHHPDGGTCTCNRCTDDIRRVMAVVQPALDAKDERIAELEAEAAKIAEALDDSGIEQHESTAWRAQDLARILRETEDERDSVREDLGLAEATIERVREKHPKVRIEGVYYCRTCRNPRWPCPTIAALDQPGDQEGTT